MKVWITKYALSSGISEQEADEQDGDYIWVGSGPALRQMFTKGEWHLDEHSAKTRAEEMRVAKIASLRKSIAKLEKLKF